MKDTFKVIAITGGIGSGKSSIAHHYANKGYPVIYTDILAKEIMMHDNNVMEKLIETFGESIYSEGKILNSNYLSKITFGEEGSKENIQKLNQIVHPVVIEKMMYEIELLVEAGHEIIFVESALIYEAGLDEGFDYIIVVDADEDKRFLWSQKNMKLSEYEFRKRNSEQISTEVKKNLADFVIENKGNISEMLNSADFILELVKLA